VYEGVARFFDWIPVMIYADFVAGRVVEIAKNSKNTVFAIGSRWVVGKCMFTKWVIVIYAY
jgi:hypothetical protein